MSEELKHHRVCESCQGRGTLPSRSVVLTCWDCRGTGERDRTPTPADLAAHVAALPAEERVAVLVLVPEVVALLQAARGALGTDEDWIYADMSALRRAVAAFGVPRG